MELRPLTSEETTALRAMVEGRIDSHLLNSNPNFPIVRGALYPVVWCLLALDPEKLQRVCWLLAELGFIVGDVVERAAPSEVVGVVNTFFAVEAQRPALFLPDYLFGEALAIEAMACGWGVHLEMFQLYQDSASSRRALQSTYGPLGGDVA